MLTKKQINTLAFNLKSILNRDTNITVCQIKDQIAKAVGFKSTQALSSMIPAESTKETHSSKELDLEFLSKLTIASAIEIDSVYRLVSHTDIWISLEQEKLQDDLKIYIDSLHADNLTDIDDIGCNHDYLLYCEGDFDVDSFYLDTVDALPIKKKVESADSTLWVLANGKWMYIYKNVSI